MIPQKVMQAMHRQAVRARHTPPGIIGAKPLPV